MSERPRSEPPASRNRRKDPPADGGGDLAGQLGRYAGFGVTIGLATALFAWLGTLLDEWLGTAPAFVLVGAFLGFGAAFFSMYWRLVLEPDRAARKATDAEDEDG